MCIRASLSLSVILHPLSLSLSVSSFSQALHVSLAHHVRLNLYPNYFPVVASCTNLNTVEDLVDVDFKRSVEALQSMQEVL